MGAVRLLSAAVSQFLEWCRPRLAKSTVYLHRLYLSEMLDHLGDVELKAIDRLSIEGWAATKHRLESARKFFRWLKKVAKWIKKNPFKGIHVPKSGRRTRLLTKLEWVMMRRRSGEASRRAILASQETASRPEEVRKFRWEWIHSTKGDPLSKESLTGGFSYFVLTNYKGRSRRSDPNKPRVIPISPRLGRLLWRMRSRMSVFAGLVFLSHRGREWTANGWRCAWRRLRERLAAKHGVNPVGLVPYLARHTKATDLARKGNNARLLADFLGHATLEMTSWYIHSSADDLCAMLRPKEE